MLMTPAEFNAGAKRAGAYLARPLNLKEIRLPTGDVGSINIGWSRNGAAISLDPAAMLAEGFQGFRIIGNQTSLRCNAWDGVTVGVGRGNFVVQLENLTVYAGRRCAVQFGGENFDGDRTPTGALIHGTQRVAHPKFMFRAYGSRFIAPPPEALGGVRAKWVLFGYQYDEHLRDVLLDAIEALEHARYRHHSAKMGDLWQNVEAMAAGECKKDRADITETGWPGADVWSISHRCRFSDWGQPHSNWREGAAIVHQNPGSHLIAEECLFRGRPLHAKCIMVSANANSYDMLTGKVDQGFANGYIKVYRSAFGGEAAGFWNNEQISVYRDGGGPPMAAQGLWVNESACYGRYMKIGAQNMPARRFVVSTCNTPPLKNLVSNAGFDTTYETVIPTATRLVPVSEGIVL
jgi:hypothetical protein